LGYISEETGRYCASFSVFLVIIFVGYVG